MIAVTKRPENARFPTRAFIWACVIVSVWVNASEVFRYFVFVMPMMRATLATVPGVAPMDLAVFLIWGVWDTLLVVMIVLFTWLYAQAFGASLRSAVIAGTLSWLFFFVLFWLALFNMNLAEPATLAVALPLAWFELVIASALALRFLPAPPKSAAVIAS